MRESSLRVLLHDNAWIQGMSIKTWMDRFSPDPFIPRAVLFSPDERIHLVVGPRQAGKSTLIWSYLTELQGNILYLNCDEPAIMDLLQSPAIFLSDVEELQLEIEGLFFDEIQRLPEAGLFLKGLVDRRTGYKIFATGSSSFDLEAKTRESLSGRAKRTLLLPFSLDEISNANHVSNLIRSQQVKPEMEKMLQYGGYPQVFLRENPQEELGYLVEALIIRDASDRFRIKHISAFRRILELMASQIGNLCNFSKWASIAAISNDTVADYAKLLEDTHIIRFVRPYVGGKRSEITRSPKIYFIDNGIRNRIFGGFSALENRSDQGALFKNFVFTEILKHINPILDSIRFWRSKSGAEVDFVINLCGQIIGCEVKFGDPRMKISRSTRSFIEAYEPELFLIVCQSPARRMMLNKTEIRFIQAWEICDVLSNQR